MDNAFALLFLAAIVGVFKPYIGNLQRRHFGIAAALFFVAFTVFVQPSGTPAADAKKEGVPKALSQGDKTELVKGFQATIFAGMKPCDTAGAALAKVGEGLASGKTTVYDGYSAAKQTEVACGGSWKAISAIKVPEGLSEAGRNKAAEAIELCSNAALAKQVAAEHMSEVFNGDMRPSMIQENQEKAQSAQQGLFACVTGVFAVATEEGVDINKLKQE